MDYLAEWFAFLLTLLLALPLPATSDPPSSSMLTGPSLGVTPIQIDPVSGDRVKDSITRLSTSIRSKPSAYGYVTLGVRLIQDAQVGEAIVAFRKALELPTSEHSENLHALAYEGLALASMLQGRVEEAIVAYKAAIKLSPNKTRAYLGLGFALKEVEQLEAGLTAFYQGLSMTDLRFLPDSLEAKAYNAIGEILQRQGNFSEAANYYRQALRSEPDYMSAWNNLLQSTRSAGVESSKAG